MIPVYYWLPALGCLGVGFMFMNMSAVSGQFMKLFDLNYAGLGFFLSSPFWAHSLVQVPAGLVVDRLGTLRSLVLSCLLCAVGGLVPLLSPHSLWLAVIMRLVIGLASGLLFLSVVSAVRELCPASFLTRAQGLQGAAFSFGTMVPYLVLPYFGQWAWAAAYALGASLPLLLLALINSVSLDALREQAARKTDSLGLWTVLKNVARSRRIWFIGCCHGISFGSITALGNWLPVMLEDCDAAAGGGVGLDAWALPTSFVLLGGTLARIMGGELGRALSRRTLLLWLVAAIGVFYVLLSTAGNVWWLLAAAVGLALCCGGTYATVFTLAIESSAPAHVATGIGFMSMVANFVNVGLILLLGVVREYASGFAPALLVIALCALTLFLWGKRLNWGGAEA